MTIQELIDQLQDLTEEQKQKDVICVDPNGFSYGVDLCSFDEEFREGAFVLEIDYGNDEEDED